MKSPSVASWHASHRSNRDGKQTWNEVMWLASIKTDRVEIQPTPHRQDRVTLQHGWTLFLSLYRRHENTAHQWNRMAYLIKLIQTKPGLRIVFKRHSVRWKSWINLFKSSDFFTLLFPVRRNDDIQVNILVISYPRWKRKISRNFIWHAMGKHSKINLHLFAYLERKNHHAFSASSRQKVHPPIFHLRLSRRKKKRIFRGQKNHLNFHLFAYPDWKNTTHFP